jgi:hypothetical protein
MKTHFTAEDIGKTFATSQEGVTAKLVSYNGSYIPCLFILSNENVPRWFYQDGHSANITIHKDKPLPSEADLLRKEIEELKAKLNSKCAYAVEYSEFPDSPTLISLHLTMEGANTAGEIAKSEMIEDLEWSEEHSEIIIREINIEP